MGRQAGLGCDGDSVQCGRQLENLAGQRMFGDFPALGCGWNTYGDGLNEPKGSRQMGAGPYPHLADEDRRTSSGLVAQRG